MILNIIFIILFLMLLWSQTFSKLECNQNLNLNLNKIGPGFIYPKRKYGKHIMGIFHFYTLILPYTYIYIPLLILNYPFKFMHLYPIYIANYIKIDIGTAMCIALFTNVFIYTVIMDPILGFFNQIKKQRYMNKKIRIINLKRPSKVKSLIVYIFIYNIITFSTLVVISQTLDFIFILYPLISFLILMILYSIPLIRHKGIWDYTFEENQLVIKYKTETINIPYDKVIEIGKRNELKHIEQDIQNDCAYVKLDYDSNRVVKDICNEYIIFKNEDVDFISKLKSNCDSNNSN